MRLKSVICLSAALMFGGSAVAEVRLDGDVEYGVFESPQSELEAGQRILRTGKQPIERTTVVPAKLGTKFGLRYSLAGKREGDTPLTLLYFTPGLVTPDGERHDKLEVVQALVPGAADDVMAFEFTEHHELVRGEWHFMVFQGDRKLVEQRFDVR